MKTHRFWMMLTAFAAFFCGWIATPSLAQYDEKYRPQYHFSPQSGWMGDPDGLVYYGGYYHMFWWGHAISKDLVHWMEMPWPMQGGDGSFDYYSGSVVVDKANSAGFGADSMVAIYSMHRKSDGKETVGLSSSQNLTDFKFYGGNPVMDQNTDDFRDPQVFWHAPTNRWIMVIALPRVRALHFYSSTDLKNWHYLSDFIGLGAQGSVWETPDLFQLPVDGNQNNKKWVLAVGVGPNRTQYFTGDFDGTRFVADEPTRSFLQGESGGDGTVYADFNGTSYNGWTTTGTAFGYGPDRWPTPPHLGAGQVNSFGGSDAATGTLTSPPFNIEKKSINFLIAGGKHPGQTCINLLVNNQVVRTATGDGTLALKRNGWDVSEFRGQSARLQIVDSYGGSDLGYITLDHITFADQLRNQTMEQALWADYGSDFYAARTWRNYDDPGADGRTVWCGWMGNWDYAQSVPTSWGKGFSSIPREIALTSFPEGVRLTQTPIPELQSLRGPQTSFFDRDIPSGTTDLTEFTAPRNCYEIEAEFDANTDTTFGFNLLVGNGRRLMLGYNARTSNLFLDRSNTSDWSNASFAGKMTAPVTAENGVLKLRIFVDQSSIEVFTNRGQVVLSALTFPGDGQTGIQLFSEDGTSRLRSFRAWGLKTSWNQGAYKSNVLPGTLEAEDFNTGGEGVGYHDTDSANRGGKYRPDEGVDIEDCSEGGHNVAFLEAGEWLDYSVKSNAHRTYQVTARVAGAGGRFHLEMNGTDVTGPITVSDTGGFQQWASITRNVAVPMGENRLRFVIEEGGFNVDKFIVSNVLSGGLYKISARHSAKVLDAMGQEDGAGLQQWNSLGGDNQKWRVEQLETGAYRLTSQSSGKVVDVDGSGNGILPQLWPWWGGDKQRWALNNVADDFYSIAGKESGKALEVRDFSRDDGARVQQWDYLGGENQQWKFDLIEPIGDTTLSVGDVRVREGDAGTTNAVFTVTLNAPATRAITVKYATADGTATASDYEATSGTLTIPIGQTQGTIVVPVKGDLLHEDDETFVLNLSDPANATLARAAASATIVNDDALSAVITPRNPTTNQTITANANSEATGLVYTFSVNGTQRQSGASNSFDLGQPDNGDRGDEVSVVVAAGNGQTSDSDTVVVANSLPTVGVNITATNPAPNAASTEAITNSLLTATPIGTDADSSDANNLVYTYRWKVNGQVRAQETGKTIDLSKPGNGDRDDIVSVDVTVTDPQGGDATNAASVTVGNTAPIAQNVTFNVNAGQTVRILLQATDVDTKQPTRDNPRGVDTLFRFIKATNPTKGLAVIETNEDGRGVLVYKANADAKGQDTVRFTATDTATLNNGNLTVGSDAKTSNAATATARIIANRPPSGANLTFSAQSEVLVARQITLSDPDAQDPYATLRAVRTSGPSKGQAFIRKDEDGIWKLFYKASQQFQGDDQVRYVVIDKQGAQSAPAIITIRILNNKPTVSNARLQVESGGSGSIPIFGQDNSGAMLTFKRVNGPNKGLGRFQRDENGVTRFFYQNNTSFTGNDQVRFIASNGKPGGDSEVGTIDITVVAAANRASSVKQNLSPSAGGS